MSHINIYGKYNKIRLEYSHDYNCFLQFPYNSFDVQCTNSTFGIRNILQGTIDDNTIY
jgi:hypothetical protein